MSVIRKLGECLQDLKTVDYSDTTKAQFLVSRAEDALNYIYLIGLKQKSFTSEEKRTFGPLIARSVKALQINIESTAYLYRTRLDNSVLMKRSAIQFLIDNYSQFPVGNSTLAEKFQEVDIQESVGILDKLIDKWCHMTDSDLGSSDRESAGASKVPESHIWWSK